MKRYIADQSNLIFWNDYRLTVLGAGLIRIEKSENKAFRDNATQTVLFRDAKKQNFSIDETSDSFKIALQNGTVILKKNFDESRILIGKKSYKIDNSTNLFGSKEALDRANGDAVNLSVVVDVEDHKEEVVVGTEKIVLGFGVVSENGIAVLDDSNSYSLDKKGNITDEKANGLDLYVFIYPENPKDAVNAFYSISDMPPLIPRYTLGNWWSRYRAYTDREYMTVLERFKEREIPISVAVIDVDWHYNTDLDKYIHFTENGKFGEKYGTDIPFVGYTGYTWNETLFPDYKEFLSELQNDGYKTVLNIHPAGGVRYWDRGYKKVAKSVGKNPAKEEMVPFEIENEKFSKAYFKNVLNPYEKEGVDVWWMDWRTTSKNFMLPGLAPLFSINDKFFKDITRDGKLGVILSPYSGIGAHRYPIGFSGDTVMSWDTLKYLPYFTQTASNIGYTWWSHDIGGHCLGISSGELYLRFIQFGVFSPINRLHCNNDITISKEPWVYENGYGRIAEDWLKLRHQLIPYIYTFNYLTHEKGLPLVRPVYHEHFCKKALKYQHNEYYFGDLIVCPITEKVNKDGFASVKVWLPGGEYTDIFTGDRYVAKEGGEEFVLYRHLENIPVLAKSGTILTKSLDKGNSVANPSLLKVQLFNGNGEFSLYEDEGNAQKKAFTNFRLTDKENLLTLKIDFNGDKSVLPQERKLILDFPNIKDGKVTVLENGKKLNVKKNYTDNLSFTLDFSASSSYEITVEHKENELEVLLERTQKVLLFADDFNKVNRIVWRLAKEVKNAEELKKVIVESSLSSSLKKRLLENMK